MRFLKLVLLLILVLALIPVGFAGWRMVAERQMQEPVPEEGRLVPTAFGRIYVEEAGPEEGRPVLLVHGLGAWSALWRGTADRLASEGYRVIAFDMPPFGWSDRQDGRGYDRATQSRRLMALVDALGVKPILVAHSFGAGAAAEAAMARPQSFAGLVLVDAALGVGQADHSSLPGVLTQPILRHLATASIMTNPLLTRWLLARFVSRSEAATEEVAGLLAQPFNRRGTTGAYADWLPTLFETPNLSSAKGEGWAALRLPLAIIWGGEDTVTPPSQGRYISDLTGAPMTMLEGVGHIPQIEDPEAFQAALVKALAELGPAPTFPAN